MEMRTSPSQNQVEPVGMITKQDGKIPQGKKKDNLKKLVT